MGTALGKLDHVDNVTSEIDLEGTPPQGCDVYSLDDTAQNLRGLSAAILCIESFMQVFDLAPIEFCERAQLRKRYPVSSPLIDRVDGGVSWSDDANVSMYEARERIMEALSLLGGSMGPVVWDVIGSELSLREHVARQVGVKRVTVHEARGRLIAGLDILARAWL